MKGWFGYCGELRNAKHGGFGRARKSQGGRRQRNCEEIWGGGGRNSWLGRPIVGPSKPPYYAGHSIACENRRFSSLIAAEGRFARKNFCDSATEIPCCWREICPKSVQKRWLLRWQSSCIVLANVYEWQTKDKRPQRSNVNAMYLQQESQYRWNIFFSRRSIGVLLEFVLRWTQQFTKIDQKKRKIEQIYIWNRMTTRFIM